MSMLYASQMTHRVTESRPGHPESQGASCSVACQGLEGVWLRGGLSHRPAWV